MIRKQPIFASVVVAAAAVTALATISIEAFQPTVRQVVPSHHCDRRIDTTENKYSMLSSTSSSLDLMKCHPSLVMLHQAADAWTGGGGGGGSPSDASASRLASGGGYGALEQIEYKIYPDGRVEELVRGIKGNNCQTVTEAIHEQLGKVVATEPTEEMYEQEVKVSQTLYNTDSTTNGDWSSSSW